MIWGGFSFLSAMSQKLRGCSEHPRSRLGGICIDIWRLVDSHGIQESSGAIPSRTGLSKRAAISGRQQRRVGSNSYSDDSRTNRRDHGGLALRYENTIMDMRTANVLSHVESGITIALGWQCCRND